MWNDILVTEFRNDEIERPRKQFEMEAKARERANQFVKESLPRFREQIKIRRAALGEYQ